MLIFCTVGGLAFGQQSPSLRIVARTVTLKLDPQPLDGALRQFSLVTGLKVIFLTDLGRGIIAPRVVGKVTPDAAMELLLKGSALRFEYLDSQTIAVLPARDQKLGTTFHPMSRIDDDPIRVAATDSATDVSNGNSADTQSQRHDDIEEVVVTAQRREERLQDVPISMSVLGGADLEQSAVQSVFDALTAVPGVALQQFVTGGGTFIVIRGVAPSGAFISGQSPVAYYLDAAPFSLVRSAVALDANPFDLNRVEILRGPQGTLYGASALNGVVRVLTNDPDLNNFDLKARITDSYTQDGGNNYRGDLAVNVPLVDGKLAVRAVVGGESDSGWIDSLNKRDENSSTIANYRLKVNAKPTDELSFGLSAWSYHNHGDGPSTGHTFDEIASVLPQPLHTDYNAYSAKLSYQLPAFSITSITSYLDYSNAGTDDLNPFGLAGDTFFSGIEAAMLSEELNLASTLDGNWRWSAGTLARRAYEDTSQNFQPDIAPGEIDNVKSKSYAVYGELTRLLAGGRVEITAGLRHFHDDLSQVAALAGIPSPTGSPAGSIGAFSSAKLPAEANTPRVVITWHASDRQTLYASYAQGFRSGYIQDVTDPPTVPPAKPDRLTNYEVGAKGAAFGDWLTYDAALYYMNWSEIQLSLAEPFYGIGTAAVVNSPSAGGVGSDLGLTAQITQSFSVHAGVGWNGLHMKSDVISNDSILLRRGDRPGGSPETTGGISADYAFHFGRSGYSGHLSISGSYTSAIDYPTVSSVGGPATSLFSDPIVLSRMGFTVTSPAHWSATLFCNNLNNERGTPAPYGGVPDWDVRLRPRTIGVELQYHGK